MIKETVPQRFSTFGHAYDEETDVLFLFNISMKIYKFALLFDI